MKVSYEDELHELMSSKTLVSFLLPNRISVDFMRMARKKKVPNAGIQVHVYVREKTWSTLDSEYNRLLNICNHLSDEQLAINIFWTIAFRWKEWFSDLRNSGDALRLFNSKASSDTQLFTG